MPLALLRVDEDAQLVLTGVALADTEGDKLRLAVRVCDGLFSLTEADLNRLTVVNGIGIGSLDDFVVVEGPAEAVAAALARSVYRPRSDWNSLRRSPDLIHLTVSNGPNKVGAAVRVIVASVNDVPVVQQPG